MVIDVNSSNSKPPAILVPMIATHRNRASSSLKTLRFNPIHQSPTTVDAVKSVGSLITPLASDDCQGANRSVGRPAHPSFGASWMEVTM